MPREEYARGRMMAAGAIRKATVVLITLALLLVFSCREPTQVTLVITTDVPCDQWKGATVTIGSASEIETKAPFTTTTTCRSDGSAGTLVLVPSGAEDSVFAVKVVGGKGRDPAECVAPVYGPGCIVARRTVGFLPNQPLTLAIPLRDTCSTLRCGANDTCAGGRCRNAKVPDPSACAGKTGCGEDVLGSPESTDCATLGKPADENCWDVSASFGVANYARDGKNGLHAFGQVVPVGKRVYAFLDGSTDETYTTTQGHCSYKQGTTFVYSPGWDIERKYDPKSGYTILVRGRSQTDCNALGQFLPLGAALCSGVITLNHDRGWRMVSDGSKCDVSGRWKASDTTDSFGRRVFCSVDSGAGTTSWEASATCGTVSAPLCCGCPEAANVDIKLGLARN